MLEALLRYDEAETAWNRIALAPDLEQRTAGVLGLARVRLARDEPAAALQELDALPYVAEGFALTAAQVRGEALRAVGDLDGAAAVYRALDADAESRVVGALGLGEVALARDEAAGALATFQRAFDMTSDRFYRAHALAGVARAQSELGDAVAARATVERLRREFPDREDALQAAGDAAP